MTHTSLLTTRPLAHSDFAAWFSLWTRYLHHNGRAMAWTDRAALFRDMTDPTNDAAAQVVEYAGKMIGFAHCQIDHAGESCHVQDLFVIPAFQAMRAGAVLMREVYRMAEVAQANAVFWVPPNQPAPQRAVESPLPLRKAA